MPEIAEGLGLRNLLPQAVCQDLHAVVAKRCHGLGLPVPGDGLVTLFHLHAGVADAQLHHLVDAFLAQEEASGFPPAEDGYRLNLWEDQALEYLHPSVKVLRRPILWDATGWYAALYARCRQGDPSGHSQAAVFAKVLEERQEARKKGGGGDQPRPEPRLAIDGTDLALRLPEGTERVRVSCDGAPPLRLRGGRFWPLPQPLPQRIAWELGDRSGIISVLPSNDSVLVADLEGSAPPCLVGDTAELSMSRIAIFARGRLEVRSEGAEDVNAEQVDGFLHIAVTQLRPAGLEVRVGRRRVVLRQRPYRRLAIRDGVIGVGSDGPLRAPEADLHLSTGIAEVAERWLLVELEGAGKGFANVRTDAHGQAEEVLGTLIERAGLRCTGQPALLRIELMRPGEPGSKDFLGSGVRLRAFFWPGWQGRVGNRLASDVVPGNLDLTSSQGIETDDNGFPCIAPRMESAQASLAFEFDGRTQVFRLPPGDLSITHLLPDGVQMPLPRGSRIVLTPASRQGAVRIVSQDPFASLDLCGTLRRRPFHAGRTCTIPLREIGSGWLRLLRSNGLAVDLVEFSSAFSCESLAIERRRETLVLRLRVLGRVDAVRVDLESETGEKEAGEVHFGQEAWLARPVPWFSAERRLGGRIDLLLVSKFIAPGLRLGCLSIRDPEGWHPLTSSRGDVVTVALESGPGLPNDLWTTARLKRVLSWLDLCHTPESWSDGGVGAALTRRRDELAALLAESRGGRAWLLSHAISEAWREARGTWMPPMHLLDACHDLFESPADVFEKAGSILSVVHAIATSRLREMEALEPSALLAFRNARQAITGGERLQSFDAARLFNIIASPCVNRDPFAGRRWTGQPLLGPAHWRAAHERLEDRIEETGFFGEDPEGLNGQRSGRILRLCPVRPEGAGTLLPVPPSIGEERADLHRRLSTALLTYARAARTGRTRIWGTQAARASGLTEGEARAAMGDLLRLAPELFAFHLIIAELEGRGP